MARTSVSANNRRKVKGERRKSTRFAMGLPVYYTVRDNSWWGHILNIGSGGALFTINQPVMPGNAVELRIGWPALVHDSVHLNLVAKGTIVRVEQGRAAVRFTMRAFRTSSSEFLKQAVFREFHSLSSQC